MTRTIDTSETAGWTPTTRLRFVLRDQPMHEGLAMKIRVLQQLWVRPTTPGAMEEAWADVPLETE